MLINGHGGGDDDDDDDGDDGSYDDGDDDDGGNDDGDDGDDDGSYDNGAVGGFGVKPLFHSSQKPTRRLAASAFKYCDWIKVLAASLLVSFCDEWRRACRVGC